MKLIKDRSWQSCNYEARHRVYEFILMKGIGDPDVMLVGDVHTHM